jgi:hypothetical protein
MSSKEEICRRILSRKRYKGRGEWNDRTADAVKKRTVVWSNWLEDRREKRAVLGKKSRGKNDKICRKRVVEKIRWFRRNIRTD